MGRALISVVFGAAMIGVPFSALAHKETAGLPATTTAKSQTSPVLECPDAGTACRTSAVLLLPKTAVSVPVQAGTPVYQGTDRVVPVSIQLPATRQTVRPDFSWKSVIALLTTLALIGTIAVRRYTAGKPWV